VPAISALPAAAPEGAPVSAEQLAAQSQAGCREAFAALVELYQDRLFSFLLQLTGNHHDAEDLAQEAFLKAYLGIHRFNPACSFTTWLFTIAKRAAASHLRSRRRVENIAAQAEAMAPAADPAETAGQEDEAASVWALARQLKPKYFHVLWLRYAEGFSVAETAQIMRLTQLHVKVLLHRARGQLAGSLQRRQTAEPREQKKTQPWLAQASRRHVAGNTTNHENGTGGWDAKRLGLRPSSAALPSPAPKAPEDWRTPKASRAPSRPAFSVQMSR
jgi:RNA polymerase sigma-70 factor (ECF subfamily)